MARSRANRRLNLSKTHIYGGLFSSAPDKVQKDAEDDYAAIWRRLYQVPFRKVTPFYLYIVYNG